MQVPTLVCLTATMLMVAGWAEAKTQLEPGGSGFIKEKPAKLGKDYYVVRKGQTDQCSIVTTASAKGEGSPEGTIGGAPYASAKYAKAALKTFPECKGGEADDDEANGKKHKKQ
jgi:hypothetical protein